MNILYEDSSILICEKPAGVLSEKDGSGRDIASLASEISGCSCTAVHRLDAGTGGAIILAKSAKAAAAMSQLIQNREIKKKYFAVVKGVPKVPIGEMRDLLYRDAAKNKSYVVNRERRGVKEALLDYCTLETVKDAKENALTLVLVKLHTGRTHQIRVQFSSRGMPLVGDGKYGSRDKLPYPALWSCEIAFKNPMTGTDISVVSMPEQGYPWNLFREDSYKFDMN